MRLLSIGSLFPPHHFGGAELTWLSAVGALRLRGDEVRVLASDHRHATGPVGGEEEEPDVHRELRWYWRAGAWPKVGFRERVVVERHNAAVLRRHLRDLSPDAVLWAEMGGMSLSLIEQVRQAGVPALGLVLDGWMVYGSTVDAWTRAWKRHPRLAVLAQRAVGIPTHPRLDQAATWAFNSRFLCEDTQRRLAVSLPRTTVLHSPVDTRLFLHRDRAPWRWRLAYVGRVVADKGVDTAIEALTQLPEATLTVTGPVDERHRTELDGLGARLGVRDRVQFDPPVSRARLPEVYAEADVVVFPVRWEEPWGKAPLEAMSLGRPVVATGTGGSREYLRDGRNALLFDPGDALALAAAVCRLAADELLRDRLRAGGRATAERFSEEFYAAALGDVVDRVAASPRPPGP